MPTVQPVSMRDLLAACAAADAISRPPRPELLEAARDEPAATVARTRPATPSPRPPGGGSGHGC
ncbi:MULTISPECIES: hypothetical protein [Streptomyces]|uniref:Uncharacterized protein n=1 Tax=Streptomyces argyrophylli TaxID=2726118 RepID=A0A6M4PGY7_9ACTN|nr:MULTISPECIES: hypothetical protein [Streptomyces]QJS10455.1 hypothetical protein HKX69_13820 [Streptomyces argyrophyllae]